MLSVIIVGGGVIGLSVGWQLARKQHPVHIFDARSAGRGASWAAAGMLAPYCEAKFCSEELLRLGEESLSMIPQFLEELSTDAACSFPKEGEGTLYVSVDRDDREWLQRQYDVKKSQHMPLHWLSGDEARDLEPLLSPRVNGAIWIPDEKQIDSRFLIEALKKGFLSQGGQLTEQCGPMRLVSEEERRGVAGENGAPFFADVVINACGAWAGQFLPEVEVRPLKGQIVNLKMAPPFQMGRMIRSPRIYLAPKSDGTVRIGATSEDQGFDEKVTAGAVLQLLEDAKEVVPAVAEYEMEEAIAALRPATIDEMPLIGPSSIKGVYVAAGHGRAGFLLAPYTAHKIKKMIGEISYAHSI